MSRGETTAQVVDQRREEDFLFFRRGYRGHKTGVYVRTE